MCFELGKLCPHKSQAFDVGCIITNDNYEVLSYGYSRKYGLERNEHAEEIAINELPKNITKITKIMIFTSMEPCSRRLSGKKSCVDRILNLINEGTPVIKIIYGTKEPKTLVPDCCGFEKLINAKIDIYIINAND